MDEFLANSNEPDYPLLTAGDIVEQVISELGWCDEDYEDYYCMEVQPTIIRG